MLCSGTMSCAAVAAAAREVGPMPKGPDAADAAATAPVGTACSSKMLSNGEGASGRPTTGRRLIGLCKPTMPLLRGGSLWIADIADINSAEVDDGDAAAAKG